MNRQGIVIALVAAGMASAAAVAQRPEPPTGSRLGNRHDAKAIEDKREAAAAAHGMAKCLVGKHPRDARRLLSSVSEADAEKASRRLNGEFDCFSFPAGHLRSDGARLSFPTDVFRGMLAEYLVHADRQRFQLLPALPRQMTHSRPWYAATGRHVATDEMATCVADVDPTKILALLRTEAQTDAERQAFAAVTPVLGACLRAGAELKGSREAIRAALAEALYQRTQPWAVTPPQASEATKK